MLDMWLVVHKENDWFHWLLFMLLREHFTTCRHLMHTAATADYSVCRWSIRTWWNKTEPVVWSNRWLGDRLLTADMYHVAVTRPTAGRDLSIITEISSPVSCNNASLSVYWLGHNNNKTGSLNIQKNQPKTTHIVTDIWHVLRSYWKEADFTSTHGIHPSMCKMSLSL